MNTTVMTVEELMKPRFKVIAAWPGGDLPPDAVVDAEVWKDRWNTNYKMSDYPALFKKLEWWEERKSEELPEYMKWLYNGAIQVVRVDSWKIKDGYAKYWVQSEPDGPVLFELEDGDAPAIKEEYESFLNSKK